MAQVNDEFFNHAVVLTAPLIHLSTLTGPSGEEAVADVLVRNYEVVRLAHQKLAKGPNT